MLTYLQGDDAPRDVHPLHLQQSDGSKVNYHQMVPYISKEIILNSVEYHNLCAAFAEVFAWIENKASVT